MTDLDQTSRKSSGLVNKVLCYMLCAPSSQAGSGEFDSGLFFKYYEKPHIGNDLFFTINRPLVT